jgi:hypothetical protein
MENSNFVVNAQKFSPLVTMDSKTLEKKEKLCYNINGKV